MKHHPDPLPYFLSFPVTSAASPRPVPILSRDKHWRASHAQCRWMLLFPLTGNLSALPMFIISVRWLLQKTFTLFLYWQYWKYPVNFFYYIIGKVHNQFIFIFPFVRWTTLQSIWKGKLPQQNSTVHYWLINNVKENNWMPPRRWTFLLQMYYYSPLQNLHRHVCPVHSWVWS